jgi:hypothetical protein
MQAYSDPSREKDPHALPNVEVFYIAHTEVADNGGLEKGWYYWFCFPGCMPDSEANGPFDSQEEALKAMRDE